MLVMRVVLEVLVVSPVSLRCLCGVSEPFSALAKNITKISKGETVSHCGVLVSLENRTSSHHLCVETGRRQSMPLSGRTCDLCGTSVVQDEQHVLLECTCTRLRAIRDKYSNIVAGCKGVMKDLMQDERTKDLSWFVHECTRVIDLEYLDHEITDVLDETASSLLG